jgi:hypothetical protein
MSFSAACKAQFSFCWLYAGVKTPTYPFALPGASFSAACKALIDSVTIMYGLKPVPFNESSFSASCLAPEVWLLKA